MKRGVGSPRGAEEMPRRLSESSGHFSFSASQNRHHVAPDILQLPGLERPVLIYRSGADSVQLPTARALAGLGHSLHLKVAMIANKHHDLHLPYIYQF